MLLGGLLLLVSVPTGIVARHEALSGGMADRDRVQNYRIGMGVGSGSAIHTADVRTTAGLISGMIVGAAYLLLGPFPWDMAHASLRMWLTLPDLLLWWWLVRAGVVPGLRYAWCYCRRRITIILLFLLGFLLLYSLMFGEAGTAFRQRAQLLPWLLVFAGVGLEQRSQRRRLTLQHDQPGPVASLPA